MVQQQGSWENPENRAGRGPCLVETRHVFLLDASYQLLGSVSSLLQRPSAAILQPGVICSRLPPHAGRTPSQHGFHQKEDAILAVNIVPSLGSPNLACCDPNLSAVGTQSQRVLGRTSESTQTLRHHQQETASARASPSVSGASSQNTKHLSVAHPVRYRRYIHFQQERCYPRQPAPCYSVHGPCRPGVINPCPTRQHVLYPETASCRQLQTCRTDEIHLHAEPLLSATPGPAQVIPLPRYVPSGAACSSHLPRLRKIVFLVLLSHAAGLLSTPRTCSPAGNMNQGPRLRCSRIPRTLAVYSYGSRSAILWLHVVYAMCLRMLRGNERLKPVNFLIRPMRMRALLSTCVSLSACRACEPTKSTNDFILVHACTYGVSNALVRRISGDKGAATHAGADASRRCG